MFRRIGVLAVVGAAFSALSATAALAADPVTDCVDKGYKAGVRDIDLSVSPTTAGSVSAINGSALLCGSDFSKGKAPKGYKSGDITLPASFKSSFGKKNATYTLGVATRCANPKFANDATHKADCNGTPDLKEGQMVGTAGMYVIAVAFDKDHPADAKGKPQPGATVTGTIPYPNLVTKVFVQKAPGTPEGVDPKLCTKDAIACFQGTDELGLGYADLVVKASKTKAGKVRQLTLHIEQPVPIGFLANQGLSIYYGQFGTPGNAVNLCPYGGPVASSFAGANCGSAASNASDWTQKNGPKGTYNCDVLKAMFAQILGGTSATGFIVNTDTNVVPDPLEWWNQPDWQQTVKKMMDKAKANGWKTGDPLPQEVQDFLKHPRCEEITLS